MCIRDSVHPSLIPRFCGAGYYGLRVHEAALAKGVKVTGAKMCIRDRVLLLSMGTAEMSSVLRMLVSNVRMPRSHSTTSVSYTHLPPCARA